MKKLRGIVSIFTLLITLCANSHGATKLDLSVDQSISVKMPEGTSKVYEVSNKKFVDIESKGVANEIQITGRQIGVTKVFCINEASQSKLMNYEISIYPADWQAMSRKFNLYPEITVKAENGYIVLGGSTPSINAKQVVAEAQRRWGDIIIDNLVVSMEGFGIEQQIVNELTKLNLISSVKDFEVKITGTMVKLYGSTFSKGVVEQIDAAIKQYMKKKFGEPQIDSSALTVEEGQLVVTIEFIEFTTGDSKDRGVNVSPIDIDLSGVTTSSRGAPSTWGTAISGEASAKIKSLVGKGKGSAIHRSTKTVLSGKTASFTQGGELLRTESSGDSISTERIPFGFQSKVSPIIMDAETFVTDVALTISDASRADELTTMSESTTCRTKPGQTILLCDYDREQDQESTSTSFFIFKNKTTLKVKSKIIGLLTIEWLANPDSEGAKQAFKEVHAKAKK